MLAHPICPGRRIARGATLALFAGLLAACGQKTPPPAPPPPEVTVVEVSSRAVPLPYEFPGRLEGSREVDVLARVSGVLLRRSYEEGQPVQGGQTLFVIDPAPYEAAVQAAQAQLAEEQARLANAERELARLAPLAAKHAVSQRDYDEALSETEQSRAAVQSAQAHLTQVRLDLSYTSVQAPISGLASRALHSEGSLVGPGEDALLTRISQVKPIWVRFAISDEELLALRRAVAEKKIDAPPADRFEVELVFADRSTHDERGRVNFSDPLIDPRTGSVDLRAELPNQTGTLVTGQFVRVRLLGIERPNTLLVPQRAVQQGQQGKFVFVVDADGKAAAVPVVVGEWIGDDWIIESGLAGGERVIVDGAVRVRPGVPVRLAGEAPASAADGKPR